jgi:hypothetical protein
VHTVLPQAVKLSQVACETYQTAVSGTFPKCTLLCNMFEATDVRTGTAFRLRAFKIVVTAWTGSPPAVGCRASQRVPPSLPYQHVRPHTMLGAPSI